MNVFVAVITGVLGLSALITVIRIVRGPTILNRALATDALVSCLICALGVESVVNRHSTTLPILISLSLVGFIASVAMARFVARDIDPGAEEGASPDSPGAPGEGIGPDARPDSDVARPTIDRAPRSDRPDDAVEEASR